MLWATASRRARGSPRGARRSERGRASKAGQGRGGLAKQLSPARLVAKICMLPGPRGEALVAAGIRACTDGDVCRARVSGPRVCDRRLLWVACEAKGYGRGGRAGAIEAPRASPSPLTSIGCRDTHASAADSGRIPPRLAKAGAAPDPAPVPFAAQPHAARGHLRASRHPGPPTGGGSLVADSLL